jgi:polyhydroxybutyrate depolymerase
MRIALRLSLVLVCALAAPVSAAPEPSAGCRHGPLAAAAGERREVGERTYLLDAPAGPGDRPLPLVVAFHGFRSSPEALRAGADLAALSRDEGVIVACPAGRDGVELLGTRGRGWDLRPGQTTDRDFVRTLLDHLEGERCVDRRRIYATGFSNGGFLANLLACQLAGRLAAVAAISGAVDLGGCAPARPVPILFLFGRADRVVPPDLVRRGVAWWVARNACRGSDPSEGCTRWTGCRADVAACEGDQGHRWPADATGRIWRFFAAHPLS